MALATARAEQAQRAAPSIHKVVTPEDISVASTTLANGFFDDPVFVWTFPDEERRRRNLTGLLEAFARPYVRHGESYLTDDATGAALWLPPGKDLVTTEEEPEFVQQLEATAAEDAGRLFELMEIFDQHHPEGTYRVLQLLAVEPREPEPGNRLGADRPRPRAKRSGAGTDLSRGDVRAEHSLLRAPRLRGHRRDRGAGRPHALRDVARPFVCLNVPAGHGPAALLG